MRRTSLLVLWLLVPALASGGCARKSNSADLVARLEQSDLLLKCSDRSTRLNRRPPSCALPTAPQVALSCAVHDTVTAPGYEPPVDDGNGFPTGGTPAPTYKIDNLQCRFTTAENNAATCTFDVENPAAARKALGKTVSFEHIAWDDNGPAHHARWTLWQATDWCLPLSR